MRAVEREDNVVLTRQEYEALQAKAEPTGAGGLRRLASGTGHVTKLAVIDAPLAGVKATGRGVNHGVDIVVGWVVEHDDEDRAHVANKKLARVTRRQTRANKRQAKRDLRTANLMAWAAKGNQVRASRKATKASRS